MLAALHLICYYQNSANSMWKDIEGDCKRCLELWQLANERMGHPDWTVFVNEAIESHKQLQRKYSGYELSNEYFQTANSASRQSTLKIDEEISSISWVVHKNYEIRCKTDEVLSADTLELADKCDDLLGRVEDDNASVLESENRLKEYNDTQPAPGIIGTLQNITEGTLNVIGYGPRATLEEEFASNRKMLEQDSDELATVKKELDLHQREEARRIEQKAGIHNGNTSTPLEILYKSLGLSQSPTQIPLLTEESARDIEIRQTRRRHNSDDEKGWYSSNKLYIKTFTYIAMLYFRSKALTKEIEIKKLTDLKRYLENKLNPENEEDKRIIEEIEKTFESLGCNVERIRELVKVENVNIDNLMAQISGTKPIDLDISGGGVKGLMLPGVFMGLAQEGIQVGSIRCSSVGALMGIPFALGMSPEEMENVAKEISMLDLLTDRGEKCNDYYHQFLNNEQLLSSTKVQLVDAGVFQDGVIDEVIAAHLATKQVLADIRADGGLASGAGKLALVQKTTRSCIEKLYDACPPLREQLKDSSESESFDWNFTQYKHAKEFVADYLENSDTLSDDHRKRLTQFATADYSAVIDKFDAKTGVGKRHLCSSETETHMTLSMSAHCSSNFPLAFARTPLYDENGNLEAYATDGGAFNNETQLLLANKNIESSIRISLARSSLRN